MRKIFRRFQRQKDRFTHRRSHRQKKTVFNYYNRGILKRAFFHESYNPKKKALFLRYTFEILGLLHPIGYRKVLVFEEKKLEKVKLFICCLNFSNFSWNWDRQFQKLFWWKSLQNRVFFLNKSWEKWRFLFNFVTFRSFLRPRLDNLRSSAIHEICKPMNFCWKKIWKK